MSCVAALSQTGCPCQISGSLQIRKWSRLAMLSMPLLPTKVGSVAS